VNAAQRFGRRVLERFGLGASADEDSPAAGTTPAIEAQKADAKKRAVKSEQANAESSDSRWVVATKQVREAAKWTVATAGAVGAVVFGGGPLLTGGDEPVEILSWRYVAIVVCALIGVLGLMYFIGRTARVLLPYEVTLHDLPTEQKLALTADADRLLPGQSETYDDFVRRVRVWPRALHQARTKIAGVTRELGELADDDPQRNALQAELAAYTDRLPDFERNVEIYTTYRDEILERAAYSQTRLMFTSNVWKVVLAVVAIVFGATSYLLLLGQDADDDENSMEGATEQTAPRVGQLTPSVRQSAQLLWSAVGLDDCDANPGNGEPDDVSVIVLDGDGTPNSPFTARTLGPESIHPDCALTTFSVIDAVAQMGFVEPETITIEYTEAPSTTTTSSTTPTNSAD